MAHYNNLGGKDSNNQCIISSLYSDVKGGVRQRPLYRNLCLISVIFGFSVGLLLGILLPFVHLKNSPKNSTDPVSYVNASAAIRTIFLNNSYGIKNSTNVHPTVSFVDRFSSSEDDSIIENGIYWGSNIEKSLPEGYLEKKHQTWADYVRNGVAVKLEGGCGRMQNRLVTFQDGLQGCVRYRQNTDQIQGELFSFYLAQLLRLPNLAPSTVSTVNLKAPLWQNLATEIAAAQWNSNRPVVLTQYISDLDSANIPPVFKPVERHLNKYDVLNMTGNNVNVLDNGNVIKNLVELAQWSDLIIFDYLTANLDRIVNNLYNYQWNVNIMDAPAHNLARKVDTNLLIFLDNESGLLHGYRLLKKYEIYHSVLLDNLCLFRKPTADIIKTLRKHKNVGLLLRSMFERRNNPQVKDVLPTLPDKSIKILNERIEKVCELHIRENEIEKTTTKYEAKAGKSLTVSLSYPRLVAVAIPSKMPAGCPKYLSQSSSVTGENPRNKLIHLENEDLSKAVAGSINSFQAYNNKKSLSDLNELKAKCNVNTFHSEWLLVKKETCVNVLLITDTPNPKLQCSV